MNPSSLHSIENRGIPPANSTDPIKEHEAVRNHAGLFNLTSYGKISIKGKDRVKFLQGLTTNDITKLSEGTGLYTILPTVKGKIASETIVCFFPEELLLILHPELKNKTLQILNKFKIGSDAQIEDLTEKLSLLSIQGPQSDPILADWLQQPIPPLLPYQFFSPSFGEIPFQIIHHGWSGETGFDLLIPSSKGLEIRELLLKKGEGYGMIPAGAEAFETLRVEAGLPLYGSELSEEVLPQEAGLESRAISYTKGCYIGQETIARLHYLGHTNRSLVGFYPEHDIPQKNDKIVSGDKIAGSITSAVFSPSLKRVIAMGYLHRPFIQPGTPVEIEHEGKKIGAVVTKLPFYKSEQKKGN